MALKTALFYERYELKYHIPLYLVDEICDYISSFCELDHFSKISHDGYYSINNLYLDTPNFLFLRRRLAGVDDRFNMRIRTYGDEENDLYFLEVKNKQRGFVKKTRAKINGDEWFNHFREGTLPKPKEDIISNDFAYDFGSKLITYRAEPVVFTQYRRKALFSTIDEYARVTFDRDMRFIARDDYTFERSADMQYYDNPNYFDPNTNIILELKCETKVPLWMIDLIRRFNLTRSSFSKFVFGVNEVMQMRLPSMDFPHRQPAYN